MKKAITIWCTIFTALLIGGAIAVLQQFVENHSYHERYGAYTESGRDKQ